jgi:hypothetical protein
VIEAAVIAAARLLASVGEANVPDRQNSGKVQDYLRSCVLSGALAGPTHRSVTFLRRADRLGKTMSRTLAHHLSRRGSHMVSLLTYFSISYSGLDYRSMSSLSSFTFVSHAQFFFRRAPPSMVISWPGKSQRTPRYLWKEKTHHSRSQHP